MVYGIWIAAELVVFWSGICLEHSRHFGIFWTFWDFLVRNTDTLDVCSLSQSFEFRRSDDNSEKFEEKGSFCLSRQIRHFLQSNFEGRPDFKRVICLVGLCNNFWSWVQNLHGTGAVHFVRTATAL